MSSHKQQTAQICGCDTEAAATNRQRWKIKLYFGTTYHNNTTEVSVYAACMSCHQIIFFWSLLRRRLQAASDDVVYSSVSSRGWIAALSLPPSTNQLQEAVSCGSLCKSVWWSCGSTLTLYRTIKKLQRDESKAYLQLCGAACAVRWRKSWMQLSPNWNAVHIGNNSQSNYLFLGHDLLHTLSVIPLHYFLSHLEAGLKLESEWRTQHTSSYSAH